jgi:mannose-6-phosphate isomerase-like protein (cupin superfamily)
MMYQRDYGITENMDLLIVNVFERPWRHCRDENGLLLPGIRGVEGASGLLESGLELGIDRLEMAPGSAFEPHTHDGAHILFGLQGRGELFIAGECYVISPGDTVFVPANVPHAVRTSVICPEAFSVLAIGYPHKKVYARDRMRLVKQGLPA